MAKRVANRSGTELGRTGQAFRQGGGIFQALLESAPDAIVAADRSGRIVIVNARAEEVFGYERDELLGRPVEVLMPQRLQAEHRRKRSLYFADPRVRPMGGGLGVTGRRKDGSEFPAEVSLGAVETDEGLLALSSCADITHRKRVEEELRQTSETLQALVQASPVGITVLDPDGTVRMWNPAAERIFGWREDEVLGGPLPTVPEGKESEHRKLREAVLRGEAFSDAEIQRRRKDGALLDISLSTAPWETLGARSPASSASWPI